MHVFNKRLQYVASENCFSLAIVMFTAPSTQNHHIILTAASVAKEAGLWLCIGQDPSMKNTRKFPQGHLPVLSPLLFCSLDEAVGADGAPLSIDVPQVTTNISQL